MTALKSKKPFWAGLCLAIAMIIVDQISKWVFIQKLFHQHNPDFFQWLIEKAERFSATPIEMTPFFNLVMVWNPGVSFGMLQTDGDTMPLILSAIAVGVSIGFLVWLWREPRPYMAACVGLIVGGALGNGWDRWRFGAVADFFDFHINDWHYPAFNVADASISVGVVLLLIDALILSQKKKIAESAS